MGMAFTEEGARAVCDAFLDVSGTRVFATEDGKTEIYVSMRNKDKRGVLCPDITQVEHFDDGSIKKTTYEWKNKVYDPNYFKYKLSGYGWAKSTVWPNGKGCYNYLMWIFVDMEDELKSDELIPEMKKFLKEAILWH